MVSALIEAAGRIVVRLAGAVVAGLGAWALGTWAVQRMLEQMAAG